METTDRIQFIQIEITTMCKFDCFYCSGRDMPQRHMEQDVFNAILESLPAGHCTVSLQGEGEPTLHPGFIIMAKQVRESGYTPYTITNCSRIDPAGVAAIFPQIGISLDTLDPVEAHRIGRHNLRQVLANLEQLIALMGADRIIVHTADYGQQLDQLRRFTTSHKLGHIVQPLQSKEDYKRRYHDHQIPSGTPVYNLKCRFLLQPVMRYFDVTGQEMPCCFIKDTSGFVSTDQTRALMLQGKLPDCCAGCREIAVINTR